MLIKLFMLLEMLFFTKIFQDLRQAAKFITRARQQESDGKQIHDMENVLIKWMLHLTCMLKSEKNLLPSYDFMWCGTKSIFILCGCILKLTLNLGIINPSRDVKIKFADIVC